MSTTSLSNYFLHDKVFRWREQDGEIEIEFGTVKKMVTNEWCSLYFKWESGATEPVLEKQFGISNAQKEIQNKDIALYQRYHEPCDKKSYFGQQVGIISTQSVFNLTPVSCPNLIMKSIPFNAIIPLEGKFRIGDKILYRDWIGTLQQKMVKLTWEFQNPQNNDDSKICGKQTRPIRTRELDRQLHIGKNLTKFPENELWSLEWETGWSIVNQHKLQNQPALLKKKKIKSLTITWISSVTNPTDTNHPPDCLTNEMDFDNTLLVFPRPESKLEQGESGLYYWTGNENTESLSEFKKSLVKKYVPDFGNVKKEEEVSEEPLFKRARIKPNFQPGEIIPISVWNMETSVEINFMTGLTQTVNSHDLKPIFKQSGGIQWDNEYSLTADETLPYKKGDIVSDILNLHPFCMITEVSTRDQVIKCFWMAQDNEGMIRKLEKIMSHHDIEINREFLLARNERSIVTCEKDKTIGAIVGVAPDEAKVLVKPATNAPNVDSEPPKKCYPHELKCLRKSEQSDHFVWSSFQKLCENNFYVSHVKNEGSVDTKKSEENFEAADRNRSILTLFDKVPTDHSFYDENNPLGRLRPSTEFMDALKESFQHFIVLTDMGFYIDSYLDRRDLFTVLVPGGKNSPFEDILFFMDIQLSLTYPNKGSTIQISFRKPDSKFDLTSLHPQLGMEDCIEAWVETPNETGTTEITVVTIPQIVVLFRDSFLSSQVRTISDSNEFSLNDLHASDDFCGQREFNEKRVIKSMEYLTILLANPPILWKNSLAQFYKLKLTRLIDKYTNWYKMKSPIYSGEIVPAMLKAQMLDFQKLNKNVGIPYLLYPWTLSFTLALQKRLALLKQFL